MNCHAAVYAIVYPARSGIQKDTKKDQSRMACVCTESPVHSFIPPWVTWLSSGIGVCLGNHELKTPPLLL